MKIKTPFEVHVNEKSGVIILVCKDNKMYNHKIVPASHIGEDSLESFVICSVAGSIDSTLKLINDP